MATKPREAPKRRKTPWRDNAEALIVAIMMAVFLKYFLIEAYKIPTGSMQPTLMGQPFGDGDGLFDRILVDKLSYHFRDPKRWEVAVFKYPLDRSKNFVKRVWGVGPEELRIAYGDVWVRPDSAAEWHIPQRPRGVQGETWKALDLGADDAQASWKVERGEWRVGDRALEAPGAGSAQFIGHGGGPILDRYLDGYPAALKSRVSPRDGTGVNPVGDVRLSGRVRAAADCTAVVLELTEGGRTYRFTLPGPAAQAGAEAVIEAAGLGAGIEGPTRAQGAGQRLEVGDWTDFGVQNLDDRLELELGGTVIASLDVPPAADQAASVRVAVPGGAASFEALQVYRDIYYMPGRNGSVWQVPDRHYFMLGDNTQDSSDSREWTFLNMRWKGMPGSAEAVVRGNWRPYARGGNPLDANPLRDSSLVGPLTWFRDEWGENHTFPTADEVQLAPNQVMTAEPFVPRELIAGRALAVFWPVSFRLGLWRPRWVH